MNMASMWEAVADRLPHKTAQICGDRRTTFGQFDDRAARLASALEAAGIGAGAKVALVLADLVMPGMGGRELGTRLQELHPGVPVLFMSAHTGDELARRRLLTPGIWFLQKPFTPDELVSQVQLRLQAAKRD